MSASRCGSTSGIATSSTPWRSATSALLFQLLWILAVIVVSAGIAVAIQLHVKRRLQINWRTWLSGITVQRWLHSGRQYQLGLLAEEVDNPDGRIAEDIRVSTEFAVEFAQSILQCVLQLFTFLSVLWIAVGHAADQAGRLRVRPAGLHGVVRRGLRPGRLAADLCAGPRPDPCRQRPPGPRGRFPLRPDAGARACRGHRPDARRGRRARAAARLAVRPALGLASSRRAVRATCRCSPARSPIWRPSCR